MAYLGEGMVSQMTSITVQLMEKNHKSTASVFHVGDEALGYYILYCSRIPIHA